MNNLLLVNLLLLLLQGCSALNKKTDFEFSENLAAGYYAEPLSATSKLVDHPVESNQFVNLPSASVNVVDAPISEVLKALSKDMAVDFDVASTVEGMITMNASHRPLDEILDRMSEQAPVVWKHEHGRILVLSDEPATKTYGLPFINSTTNMSSDTHLGDSDGLGGGNVTMKTVSQKNFWLSVEDGVKAILGLRKGTVSEKGNKNPNGSLSEQDNGKSSVALAPDTGLLTVVATAKKHREVKAYIEQLQASLKRQVFIDMKMIEVKLDSKNELGIDWKSLNTKGFITEGNFLGTTLASSPHLMIGYAAKNFEANLRMLGEQGKARLLSQPKLLVQNGQAASIRATDSLVYFTTKVSQAQTTSTGVITPPIVTTTPHTVDVGVTMTLMPAVSDDGKVNLHIRPRITRLVSYVKDPNPLLAEQNVVSEVPQIQQRELESSLVIEPGQEVALGGLILESKGKSYVGIPFSERLPGWLSWFNWITGYNKEESNRSELFFLISCHVDNGVST